MGTQGGASFGTALRDLRKVRDLSQMGLAEVAGTSQRHVSFLELGRSQPSRSMVLQIAEALGLSLRERNRLLLAAGYAAAYPQRPLEDAAMEPVRQALERMLQHHEPFPALVVNRRWDLVLFNETVGRLFALAGDPDVLWPRVCPDGRRNVLRMMLHADGLRPFVRNFEVVARALLERVQQEAGESSPAAEVLEELLRDTGLARRLPPPETGAAPSPVLATHLHAGGADLKLFAVISTFGTPQDVTADELRVASFFPTDRESEAVLRELARR